MNDSITLTVRNQIEALAPLTQSVEAFGARHHLSEAVVFAVTLALDEIVTNVVSYGYDDSADHDIHVCMSLRADDLIVEVEDDGRPFNPLEAEAPDLDASLADRKVGGLGIHLVRKLMDGLEYHREQGKNRLVMRKSVAAQ